MGCGLSLWVPVLEMPNRKKKKVVTQVCCCILVIPACRKQGDLSFNAASTMPNKEGGRGGERKKVQGRNERRGDGKARKGEREKRRKEWERIRRDED